MSNEYTPGSTYMLLGRLLSLPVMPSNSIALSIFERIAIPACFILNVKCHQTTYSVLISFDADLDE